MTFPWRLAYTVGSPEPAVEPALGYAGTFDHALDDLAATGYEGVEIQVRDPQRLDATNLKTRVAHFGLTIAALGTGPVGHDGATLTSPEVHQRENARERLKAAARLAGALEVPFTLGRTRGRINDEQPIDLQHSWLREGVLEVADVAEAAGTRLLLEPQEPSMTNLLTNCAQAIAFIRTLGHSALGLALDTHHMSVVGDDAVTSVRRAGGLVEEIQIAGPGRGPLQPGSQCVTALLRGLSETGFAGWIVMEHKQLPDSHSASRQSIGNLRRACP